MKKKLPFWLILGIALISCNHKIKVDKQNYAWKNFTDIDEQRVNLDQYQSPNTRDCDQDDKKLVIVCSAGGGARAASFTIGVMLELERIAYAYTNDAGRHPTNALNEIDYFSTVSGGG